MTIHHRRITEGEEHCRRLGIACKSRRVPAVAKDKDFDSQMAVRVPDGSDVYPPGLGLPLACGIVLPAGQKRCPSRPG